MAQDNGKHGHQTECNTASTSLASDLDLGLGLGLVSMSPSL